MKKIGHYFSKKKQVNLKLFKRSTFIIKHTLRYLNAIKNTTCALKNQRLKQNDIKSNNYNVKIITD